jgi:predicted transcriptional regulator
VKTTIFVSDDVFEAVECLARRTERSPSQLIGDAVREYLARHATDEITEAMHRVYAELEPGLDKFAAASARSTLECVVWRSAFPID